ncbi:MAG: hypothetical protein QOI10_1761 [Solirubrobacterales bacterium]|jgi:hypothetical protein|nr:hypothetical protein [Solirubrobacterales bacterium]
MSAVATRRRSALVTDPPATARSATRLFEPQRPDGGVSLEERLLAVWEDLISHGHAGCPVCGGRIQADAGCDGCGSALS